MSTAVPIWAFEVPAGADERFLTAWDEHGPSAVALHRALRDDVAFRFVAVGRDEAALPARALPFPSHRAVYSIAHEDGAPAGREGVTLIDAFEVPDGDDDAFLAGWRRARDSLAGQRGYLGTRLHRSLAPAALRYVNVARWSSPLAFARAIARPGFADAGAALPFASHPGLYLIVRD